MKACLGSQRKNTQRELRMEIGLEVSESEDSEFPLTHSVDRVK